MWSSHLPRHSSDSRIQSVGAARTRSRRDRPRPRFEVLEDRQLLSIAGSLQFDFGPTGYAVAPGYTGASNAAYSTTTGFGWQSSNGVYGGGDWWPNSNPVTSDFAYSNNATFLVDLPNGTYTVAPTLGRLTASQSQVAVWLNGQQVASGIATSPGQFITPAYQVKVTGGRLAMQVQNLNQSSSYFWLDGLSILPGTVQVPMASAGSAITTDVGAAVAFSQAKASGTGPLGVSWYFGDYGSNSTPTSSGSLQPTHTYTTPGTYTAMLTIVDANGLVSASPVTVNVNAAPTANAGSNQTVNEGSSVPFTGTLAGGTAPYTYTWNYGDGTSFSGNTATYIGTDTATQGNWKGVYGLAGYNVLGDASSYPSYAAVTPSGHWSYTWASSTTDVRALQKSAAGTTSRVAACWYGSSFTVDVNLTDGQAHRLSLYLMDYDTTKRSERIDVVDASTGVVLDSRTVSGFSGGQYVSWSLGGHVQFKVTCLAGANAVIGGLFIEPATATSLSGPLAPSHVYADQGTYTATLTVTDALGRSGISSTVVTVANVAPTATLNAPSTGTAGTPVTFKATATDPSPADTAAGFTYAWNFGDGTTGTGATPTHAYASAGNYTVSVTAKDKDGGVSTAVTKVVTITSALVISAGTPLAGNEGSSMTLVGSVAGGTGPYTYTWNYGDGTSFSGKTVSGNAATYIGTDTATQGNWKGVYGLAGYNVLGDASSYPSYAAVTPSGQWSYTWASSTTDVRALQKTAAGSTTRVAACWYGSSFTVDVNLTDGQAHRLSLYLMDYDTTKRSERIDVVDASTGVVLDSRTVSGFSGGQYVSWNLGGHVQFKVTCLAGANAVIGGLFIEPATATSLSGPLAPSHVYADQGTYTATLTVTDALGRSGISSTVVTVANVTPTATLNAPSTGTAGTPVSFKATATDPSPADTAAGFTYAWNFGDGTTGTGATPTHAYASAGNYTVSVTAKDKDGGVSTAATSTLTITSSSSLTVSAGGALTTTENTSVTFAGAVTGGSAPYTAMYWNFGDGATATGTLTPTHTYADNGIYNVVLAVTDSAGSTATSTMVVNVANVAPTASISGPTNGNVGSPVAFVGSAKDPNTADLLAGFAYNWAFGDGTTGTGQTPSHSYSSPGTYTVGLTVTDKDGGTSVLSTATIVIVAATVIPIDATWLQANGPAPYYLTKPGVTYQLQTDVTTSGTAFIALASGITFDLNGHTITYCNSSPIVVPNGGFETGTPGQAPPSWDVSNAPGATIKTTSTANWQTGWWGNQLLEIPGITGTSTIVSSAITIPQANRDYTAVISVKVPAVNNQEATVTLSVIDTVTGAVLGSANSASATRGYAPVVTFTPTTTNAVKLKVDVTAVGGQTFIADADYSMLVPSGDYGVVASPDYWKFGTQLQTPSVLANVGRVQNFTIENGTIAAGQAFAYANSALFLEEMTGGFTVKNVAIFVNGNDASGIDGYWTNGATITNSTITGGILRMTNRMHDGPAIELQRSQGALNIQGNHISGSLAGGIVVSGYQRASRTNFSSIIIKNNDIRISALVTDSYAIAFAPGVDSFEVANNTIVQVNGRGIMLDGIDSGVITNGTIHDNSVDVQEHPFLEYGQTSMEATALRIRARVGTVSNINIYNNMFYAHTSVDQDWSAIGARLTFLNGSGQNQNSNVILQNNTFKGIVLSPAPNLSGPYASSALGLSISGLDAGTGLTLIGNTFESNVTSLNIGDNDSYGLLNQDVTFTGNTIAKSASGAAMTYTSIAAGSWANTTHNIRLISMNYTNGATPRITFLGNAAEDVTIGWQLNGTVTGSSGNAVSGANVSVFDGNNRLVYSGTSNAEGRFTGIMVLATLYAQPGADPSKVTTTNLGPFTVKVTAGNRTQSQVVELTGNQSIGITL
ncbi:PKD domain-containing protein [Aquisphaera insulae]|uniref:PKD domain-containing protein n=1 Tax=Aquisphaera insulae TaxID=2712864 RepID=UPI0013ED1258|nr:PKD domain-containing protein [Aquisphaera insulae]